jgi:hypothetical protein
MTRRSLIAKSLLVAPLASAADIERGEPRTDLRAESALQLKQRSASLHANQRTAAMVSNGDESSLPERIGCFTKGLPHTQFGQVEPRAYDALLAAIQSGKHADFEKIPRGGGRRLNNPQAAFTYHLEGSDPHHFELAPPPSVISEAAALETSELYWQSLCRDVPFSNYDVSPLINKACADLGKTPASIFRGTTNADLTGQYVSQFLLKPIPFGSGTIEQRYRVPVANSDFMTTYNEWSQIQAGMPPWLTATYEKAPRYIVTGRDLAEYVHYDFTYQAYLNAALILLNSGPRSLLNCNPFKSSNSPYLLSTIQEGFITFGHAEVTDFLGRVSTAALKAAYCQKWMVHRRLRPEALGGLVHQIKLGKANHPIHPSLLNSPALEQTFANTRCYLLPQAYPEGCPMHPSYPAGHAALGGACSIILKACFDESMLLPGCVEVAPDGLSLKPCSNYSPTVGDEINKLVYNVAMGRNWAGIHYRSDDDAGLRLGEDVAISILQDLVGTYTEDFKGFSFTRLDGTKLRIIPSGEVVPG